MEKLLEIKNLSISFTQYFKGLEQRKLDVISDLSIDLYENEILAVLGSSGSGKSLLAHSILGILPPNAEIRGSFYYKSKKLTEEDKIKLRGDVISLIPQSVNFLNPLMKVKYQAIGRAEDENMIKERLDKQLEIFKKYNLDSSVGELYPHQLSGGMARKVLISTALLDNPEIIIADEPTPGLDIESVNETINDLIDLKNKGVSILLITHDINTAIKTSDRIAILYLGYVIEITETENFITDDKNLYHPYTRALFNALPENGFKLSRGHQPSYMDIPKGCPYQNNCEHKKDICLEKVPDLYEVNGSLVRCFNPLVDEN